MAKLCRRDRVFNRRYHSKRLNEHKFAIESRFMRSQFICGSYRTIFLHPHHWQMIR